MKKIIFVIIGLLITINPVMAEDEWVETYEDSTRSNEAMRLEKDEGTDEEDFVIDNLDDPSLSEDSEQVADIGLIDTIVANPCLPVGSPEPEPKPLPLPREIIDTAK